MARETLLQMLEDLASKVRSLELEKSQTAAKMQALEREKNEAVARARALEREVSELANLVTLADERLGEILKIGADDEILQPPAVNVPKESTSREQLGEFSADKQRRPKRLLPRVFIPD